ncbi:MAG TPA: chorismate mutase, partial [Patescibacteria group bacterium]|nr:chorismate mutase [Patescibacteria group bacterium]
FAAVKEVGKLKNFHELPILDEKRREDLLQTVKKKAKVLELSEQFVEKLFQTIHDHAVEIQKRI